MGQSLRLGYRKAERRPWAEMPGEEEGRRPLGRRHHGQDKCYVRKKPQSVFRKAARRALWAMARGLRSEAAKTSGARGRAETGKIRYLGGVGAGLGD